MAMTPPIRRVALAVLLASVAFGTTACGLPPASPPTPEAPVVETLTPGPADPADLGASGERPAERADAACSDFASPALLDPLFGRPVAAAPPTRTAEYIGARIADQWTVRQDGGFACEWSNVDATVTSEGRYDYDGLRLELIAASGPQWQEYSDAEGDGSDRLLRCYDYAWACSLDQYLGNGWWLNLAADNLDAGGAPTDASLRALATPVFSSIVAAASALPAADPAWTFPTPEETFGGGCTGVITGARLSEALGLGSEAVSEERSYPSIERAAVFDVGGSECRWAESSGFYDIVNIQVLPGGAWAQADAKAAMESVTGTPVPTPAVSGVPAGATALYYHVDSVSLDLVLGGTWIKLSIASGSETAGVSPEDALLAIGAEIATG
jgi:hypothetical protein